MNKVYNFYASCPRNLSELAASEIDGFNALSVKVNPGGVSFQGTIETAYRHLLWSRISSRLFFELASFKIESPDDLYKKCLSIPWNKEMDNDAVIAVHTDLINTDIIKHSTFASQRVKDAIVDQFRNNTGKRPSVDIKNPDIRINLLLKRDTATIGIDLSGESLHKRGYRIHGGPATLKENVAAAILIRCGWQEIMKKEGSFLDLFCGSGTLLIEAAMIAGDIAPGLLRKKHGFFSWKRHNPELWENLVIEAEKRRHAGKVNIPSIVGMDKSRNAIASAVSNIREAELTGNIHVEKKDIAQAEALHLLPGLILSNPPYGNRLGEIEELIPLYKSLGTILKENFKGWRASILTGNRELSMATGLKPDKINTIFNGPIECTLATFQIYSEKEKQNIQEEIKKKQGERNADKND